LLLLGAMALLLEACATVAGGHIPPSAFEFHEIVSRKGQEPGGWKVAQVNILLSRVSQGRPLNAWCDVEVGIPIENWERGITDSFAQMKAAEAADEAAQFVLRGSETFSAVACEQFRVETRRLLGKSIKGVRVTKFRTSGIEPKSFPDE
jgi:hypothetical protein